MINRLKKIVIIFPLKIFKLLWQILIIITIKAKLKKGKVIIFSRPKVDEEDIKGFAGWDMYTAHYPPWIGNNKIAVNFNKTYDKFNSLVKSKKFFLSQFPSSEFDDKHIYDLKFRHFNIFWSIQFALTIHKNNSFENINLVECGVCDGMTIFFAINSLLSNNVNNYNVFLYDAWAGMRSVDLTESEKFMANEYDYLEIDRTKKNLEKYRKNIFFNQGLLPDSLQKSKNPSSVSWLHIDLNSSIVTLQSLDFFFDRIAYGGVIIFDDYGWHGYEDTKKVIDSFFLNKKGILLPLSTGQAIFYKL